MKPGKYAVRLAKLRWREFYRMGGCSALVQGAIIKLIARKLVSGHKMKLPQIVKENMCSESEIEPKVLKRLTDIGSECGLEDVLFYVKDKESSDTQNTNIGAGAYSIIDDNIIAFYSYVWTQNIKNPKIVKERETFTCMSFKRDAMISTSNFDIGLDSPPQIDGIKLKNKSPSEVIGKHKNRVLNSDYLKFNRGQIDEISKYVDKASAFSSEDKIGRGLYQLVDPA